MTKEEFTNLALDASRKSGPCSLCFLDDAEWGRAQGVEAERERILGLAKEMQCCDYDWIEKQLAEVESE